MLAGSYREYTKRSWCPRIELLAASRCEMPANRDSSLPPRRASWRSETARRPFPAFSGHRAGDGDVRRRTERAWSHLSIARRALLLCRERGEPASSCGAEILMAEQSDFLLPIHEPSSRPFERCLNERVTSRSFKDRRTSPARARRGVVTSTRASPPDTRSARVDTTRISGTALTRPLPSCRARHHGSRQYPSADDHRRSPS